MASEKTEGNDHPRCNGCMKKTTCKQASQPEALSKLHEKRASNTVKYFTCHSIFADIAERPPEPNKVVRFRVGESGVQY